MPDPIQRFNKRNIARWAREPIDGPSWWCDAKSPRGDTCNLKPGHGWPWHTPANMLFRFWRWWKRDEPRTLSCHCWTDPEGLVPFQHADWCPAGRPR